MPYFIGYLKNHLTKHRLACTHFDTFFILIPNMDIKFNNFEFFKILSQKFTTCRLLSTRAPKVMRLKLKAMEGWKNTVCLGWL